MIESVLNLGVKGADLVISQLEKIQASKEKFSKPSSMSISGSAGNIPGGAGKAVQNQANKSDNILKSILDTLKKQRETLAQNVEQKKQDKEQLQESKQDSKKGKQEKGEEKEASKTAEAFKETGKQLHNVAHGVATLSSGAAIKGVSGIAGLIPLIGDGVVSGVNAIVTAAEAFRHNIEGAAKIAFDTVEGKSRIGNLVAGSKGENFTGRTDLDLNTQRNLAEAIGEKFGVVQKPLQDSIKELYANTKDKKAVDVNQAHQLASGNFNALGSDKGFFLQKIQDQLGNLPPTMRQAITASLQKNVSKEEQMTEAPGVQGLRAANTSFDNAQRNRASEILGKEGGAEEAVKNALMITNEINKLDGDLNQGFSMLLTGLRDMLSKVPGINISSTGSKGRP